MKRFGVHILVLIIWDVCAGICQMPRRHFFLNDCVFVWRIVGIVVFIAEAAAYSTVTAIVLAS